MSVLKSQFLKDNPEKHIWKRSSKFKSEPCELIKRKLREEKISFIEEFTPLDDRFFSIDIAFPDKKIGIEINGNQHYNGDGSLKDYYFERNAIITNNGWTLFEYHYSIAYNHLLLNEIINQLKNNHNLGEIDYSFYIRTKKVYKCIDCDKTISYKSTRCKTCSAQVNASKRKKIDFYPTKEVLLMDVENLGFCGTGRKYGVSDNCIRKWIRK